jgi:hypothetical protein
VEGEVGVCGSVWRWRWWDVVALIGLLGIGSVDAGINYTCLGFIMWTHGFVSFFLIVWKKIALALFFLLRRDRYQYALKFRATLEKQ